MKCMRLFSLLTATFTLFCFASPTQAGQLHHLWARQGQLWDNGNPFIMQGVVFDFIHFPVADLQACDNGTFTYKGTLTPCLIDSLGDHTNYVEEHLAAHDYYFGVGNFSASAGTDAFSKLSNWNVNTIRLNVDQAALAYHSMFYSTAYVTEVVQAIQLAEAKGYVVVVTLFDCRSDLGAPQVFQYVNKTEPDNNVTSAEAALTLVDYFGADRGVIIELLNEPWYADNGSRNTRTENWGYWLNGGTVPATSDSAYAGESFRGVNTIISDMRTRSPQVSLNVIGVQGIGLSMADFPGGVVDPTDDILYSVHPFFSLPGAGNVGVAPTTTAWDMAFGNFARLGYPFAITAWNTNAMDAWCGSPPLYPATSPISFLDYLSTNKIGVVGYAFDMDDTIVLRQSGSNGPWLGAPTVWPNQCGPDLGAGSLVQQYFLGNSQPI